MSRSQEGLEGVSGLRRGRCGVCGPMALAQAIQGEIPQRHPRGIKGFGLGLGEARRAHHAPHRRRVLGGATSGRVAGGLTGTHGTTVPVDVYAYLAQGIVSVYANRVTAGRTGPADGTGDYRQEQ